jgi:hypothetical protein
MTSLELLKEIDAWLSFNTEPSKEETANLRKSIKEHLTEQLCIHDVVGQSEQLVCPCTCANGLEYSNCSKNCERVYADDAN